MPGAYFGALISLSYLIYSTVRANFSDPRLLPDGTTDDGYTHLMLMGFVLIPGFYLIVGMAITGLFLALIRLGIFRWQWIAGVAVIIPNLVLAIMKLNLSLESMLTIALYSAAGALGAWKIILFRFESNKFRE